MCNFVAPNQCVHGRHRCAEDGQFICRQCKAECDAANETDVGGRCDLRGEYTFLTEPDLQRDTTRFHSSSYACKQCKDRFSDQVRLNRHIVAKHYHFPCFNCRNGCVNQWQLYDHQVNHCRQSFKCRNCDERFNELVACHRHELTRHGQFWHLCRGIAHCP